MQPSRFVSSTSADNCECFISSPSGVYGECTIIPERQALLYFDPHHRANNVCGYTNGPSIPTISSVIMADMDDFLSDTAALYGDTVPLDDGMIRYGPLVLTVAPKVCLQSHMFTSR